MNLVFLTVTTELIVSLYIGIIYTVTKMYN